MAKKFVLETSLSKDAPEGYHYVRQSLGFTTKCEACGTQSKALSFFRCSEKNADPKNPLTKYEGGMTTVCSVDCYVTTADYVAENTQFWTERGWIAACNLTTDDVAQTSAHELANVDGVVYSLQSHNDRVTAKATAK